LYLLLHRASTLHRELIATGVLGLGSIMVLAILVVILYSYGRTYVTDFILIGICALCVLSHMVLLAVTIWEVIPKNRNLIRESFESLFDLRPQQLVKWCDSQHCRTYDACSIAISDFLAKRNSLGFYLNLVLLSLMVLGIAAFIIVLIVLANSSPAPESAAESAEGADDAGNLVTRDLEMTDVERQRSAGHL
jgi:hypothetical protein